MACVDRWKLHFFGFKGVSRKHNEAFVSGIGMLKFHSVNIKCRVGSDVPDGILMKALRGGC